MDSETCKYQSFNLLTHRNVITIIFIYKYDCLYRFAMNLYTYLEFQILTNEF